MTEPRRRYVHVMVHKDGVAESRSWRIPLWLYRSGMLVAGAATLAVLVSLLALTPLFRAAARVPGLQRRVAELSAENAKVRTLAAAVDSLQRNYDRVRGMIGGDVVRDVVETATDLPVAPAIEAAPTGAATRYAAGASRPAHWPLDVGVGFVTRGAVAEGAADETHPGMDVAVPVGTAVRAAGGGTVADAGEDAEYGRFILLDHPGGYQTMYGHLSRVTFARGSRVDPGQVIGLSGNTGRSSAPHLHFEIRREGRSIDPLTMVKEGR
jgi:murein DD-endopeptidase MepM/ murein hydrolase activator NlpD